ncbi:MAG: hypothetical protein RLZZ375_333 [Pseudomonadota bacterium]|jgi:uncharacterized protein (TIGR04255 family)
MPTPAPTQGHFRPVHAAHSIEQVVFSVHFDRQLPPESFAAVVHATEQFRGEMPGGGPIQGVSFAIGGAGMPPPFFQQPIPISGVMLTRSAPDGSIESELKVEHASLSFRTTRYSRWATIWNTAQRYFSALLDSYIAAGAQLTSVGQNFVDKYVWHGEANACAAEKLLRRDSAYVATQIFNKCDLWHSHTGAFERINAHTKRLTNINVDCLDEAVNIESRRVVVITTVLTDLFGQPSYDPIVVTSNNVLAFITTQMHALHTENKRILAATITDAMASQIALNGTQS